ncbi:MAG: hypothetical protein IT377_29750 [Polyangiaceae bacterium]|nr:hypothetical protein [Myxococcales bacterium]MCC6903193.1 hypothetical protein [Polyangiaceae bacterium]
MIEFAWARGGRGRLIETNGDVVSVQSSLACAPGTPLEGELDGVTYRIKVRSCRKQGDEAELPFRIEGRFQNLTREQRARVCQE